MNMFDNGYGGLEWKCFKKHPLSDFKQYSNFWCTKLNQQFYRRVKWNTLNLKVHKESTLKYISNLTHLRYLKQFSVIIR